MSYNVVKYRVQNTSSDASLVFVGVMAGIGRNKGTWDSTHSKNTAQRHAKILRKKEIDPSVRYCVEEV